MMVSLIYADLTTYLLPRLISSFSSLLFVAMGFDIYDECRREEERRQICFCWLSVIRQNYLKCVEIIVDRNPS